ncbi:low affinity immunoglobulin gamma Fc region receptor III-A-like isoform X2 [Phyllobates terribilis]|uniref:low affinity immunoglobulin gamma Fc region receptor III-A-like isoform X2 n=1 Tax=Phyllobates terribilis TaxID=111132 RepID=UPI003CCB2C75
MILLEHAKITSKMLCDKNISVCFAALSMENTGFSSKPQVIFTPNWNKILTFDTVNITCDVGSTAPMGMRYDWYKDGINLTTDHRSININSAQLNDRGQYQCQAGGGKVSDPATLDVVIDFVILQVPRLVNEGDSIYLRCHTYPEDAKEVRGVTYYKDDKVIQSFLQDSDLRLDTVSMSDTGKYKCEKKFYYTLRETWSDEVLISVIGNKQSNGQVQQDYSHSNAMRLILSAIIIIIGVIIICHHYRH